MGVDIFGVDVMGVDALKGDVMALIRYNYFISLHNSVLNIFIVGLTKVQDTVIWVALPRANNGVNHIHVYYLTL